LLEPYRQPLPVGTILHPFWHLDMRAVNPLEAQFEKRAVVDIKQPVGDVNTVIGINADQVSVEGCVVNLRQRKSVRDDGLSQLLVRIDDYMRGIE
jgi:hypothetical protein